MNLMCYDLLSDFNKIQGLTKAFLNFYFYATCDEKKDYMVQVTWRDLLNTRGVIAYPLKRILSQD